MNYHDIDLNSEFDYTNNKNNNSKINFNLNLIQTVKGRNNEKYIHEHFFEEVYYPFLFDYSCRDPTLLKCVTCKDIFCNSCGKRITTRPFFRQQLDNYS